MATMFGQGLPMNDTQISSGNLLPVAITGAATAAGVGCGAALPYFFGTSSSIAVAIGVGMIATGAALAAWAGTVQDRRAMMRRVDIFERRLEGLSTAVEALQGTNEAADTSSEVAGELRVLRELLTQVVSRRTETRITAEQAAADELPLVQHENVLAIMQSALEDSRVDLYLQPTVKLPNRKTASYEAFSRVRDENGEVIYPSEYLETAERAGLVGTLDNLLLFRCISLIRELGVRKPGPRLFVNIAAGSLNDPEFLHEFTAFMTQHKDLSQRLVFELSANDLPQLSDSVRRHLGALARLGFPFSVDHVEDMALDLALLSSLNVQFVKVDAAKLLAVPSADAMALKTKLLRYSIDLVATRIEDERTVVEVLDLGLEYGQGYLFGEPKLARQSLTYAQAA
jgi:cyclic-di-GMP phosphodiesterase, flagellum assembly factor TipF